MTTNYSFYIKMLKEDPTCLITAQNELKKDPNSTSWKMLVEVLEEANARLEYQKKIKELRK